MVISEDFDVEEAPFKNKKQVSQLGPEVSNDHDKSDSLKLSTAFGSEKANLTEPTIISNSEDTAPLEPSTSGGFL